MDFLKTNILIITALLLASCQTNHQQACQTVKVKDAFSIELPEQYQPENDLHDFAFIQYQNQEKPAFLIGIEDSKTELTQINLRYNVEDYAWYSMRQVTSALDSVYSNYITEMEINGLPAYICDIEGSRMVGEESIDVYYNLAILETAGSFVQLIQWGDAEYISEMEDEMTQIVCSIIPETLPGKVPGTSAGSAAK